MEHPVFLKIAQGERGIASYCTANAFVLEALLSHAAQSGETVLIEATANQVNQFGGYTGMQPKDFRELVYRIAEHAGCKREQILLGGDHLGPLTFSHLPEREAMAHAITLVRQYVSAGYEKIHLDTSMRLKDDDPDAPLEDATVARRGVALYRAAIEAYEERKTTFPDVRRPVFIIGSEVPIPGGTQEKEDSVTVTTPAALRKTLKAYREAFASAGMPNGFSDVLAVVVQPGVEFGNDEIHFYDAQKAAALAEAARQENIALEGHSTDYQTPEHLKAMVKDGVRILKVGPALTFALREALYALSHIEKELVEKEKRAGFPEALEAAMLENPAQWGKYYHGTELERKCMRSYSLSDRCRYYFALPTVQQAADALFDHLKDARIPLGLLHQYLPRQYDKVVKSELKAEPKALAFDCIAAVLDDYDYAVLQG